MIAAVIAVVTSAQVSPAERLVQFMNIAHQRGIAYKATSGPLSISAKLSYSLPGHQLLELTEKDTQARFVQTPQRIAVFQDFSKTYYEYRGFPTLVSPPPDAGVMRDVYPAFLWTWTKPGSLKNAKPDGQEIIDGFAIDWIKEEFESENGMITVRTAVAADGSPRKVIFSDPMNATITFQFLEFTWPYMDIKGWKYQPPTGYMIGTAPKLHFPLQSGAKLDFSSWGSELKSINRKGLILLVTSAKSDPDDKLVRTIPDVMKELKNLGISIAELHLDSGSKPKRTWPVILDKSGSHEKQLGIPVTPYIYFLDSKNNIIRAWAGYDNDQKQKLITTAKKAFSSDEDL